MNNPRRFLDPVTIAKISNMSLRAKFVVEGFVSGLHRSPFHGFSAEFSEHREYSPGDEIKRIDWRVYGKTDKYYIKQYEEETNLKCYLILDASASMGYKSEGVTKLAYGSYLAASLAYLMLKQQDLVGLATFSNRIENNIPPRGSSVHIQALLNILDNLRPSGETNISKVLHDLAQNIKRTGLIILISDLFDDPEKILNGLKHFRYRKHDVIVFHLLDKYELTFPFEGLTIFEDLEEDLQVTALPEAIRKEYQASLQNLIKDYRSKCRYSDIDYCQIDTSVPLDEALASYLAKRERLF